MTLRVKAGKFAIDVTLQGHLHASVRARISQGRARLSLITIHS